MMNSSSPPNRGLAGEIAKLTDRLDKSQSKEESDAVGRELIHLLKHDLLTGLPNRAYLTEFIASHSRQMDMEQSCGRPVTSLTMCALDLRDFKLANNDYGHDVGDELLRALAYALRREAGDSGEAFRIGGDEFVLVLLGLPDIHQAEARVAKIARRLSTTYSLGSRRSGNSDATISTDFRMRVRIGFDYTDVPLANAMAMLQRADAAMIIAKERQETVLRFDPDMHLVQQQKQTLDMELLRLVRSKSLRLAFQPIVMADTGVAVGFEGLLEPPQELLERFPWASWSQMVQRIEEMGLVNQVSRRLLLPACRLFRALHEETGSPVYVSLNISASQLDRRIVQQVRQALKTSGLSPDLLCLEITEHLSVKDSTTAATALARLKELGVKIMMDDYGAANSTPKRLGEWAPYLDGLKIDRDHVRDLEASRDFEAIIRSARALAHEDLLGFLVVEGVETEAQLEILQRLGVKFVQGYLYARPIPEKEIFEYLRANRRLIA